MIPEFCYTLYSEHATGLRPSPPLQGCLQVWFEGVRHWSKTWEPVASDRASWRGTVKQGLYSKEVKRSIIQLGKRKDSSTRKEQTEFQPPMTSFTCNIWNKDCHSRIGLHHHSRWCSINQRPHGAYPLSLKVRRLKITIRQLARVHGITKM